MGVKTPLRKAIVTDDFLFNTSEELEAFLRNVFADDKNKHYCVIPADLVSKQHTLRGEGVEIKGCQKTRMLSFFPNGDWFMKRHICNCKSCLVGYFNQCEDDEIDVDIGSSLEEVNDNELIETNVSEMHLFVEANSFVAVYSSSKSLELFYIIHVVQICV